LNKKESSSSITRWRLILGHHAENDLPINGQSSSDGQDSNQSAGEVTVKKPDPEILPMGEIRPSKTNKLIQSRYEDLDESLAYLYDREYDPTAHEDEFSSQSYQLMEDLWDYQKDRSGGATGSKLFTIPHWINKVKELFPQEAQEILTQDAIERYNLTEILTDPEILETIEPSYEITKLLLTFRDYLSDRTLILAKELIRKTVKDLEKKFKREIQSAVLGRKQRHSNSPLKVAKNLDFKKTIHHNLRYYQADHKTLIIDKLFFNSRIQKKQEWHIIILVDQSGSMIDSVIHSSVIASIFSSIRTLKTNLIIFDTEVVDLSTMISDPVEVLMSVQLGGGTNIGKAMNYASTLVERPDHTIFVLITDFYEGGSPTPLFASIKSLSESGVILLGLTAISQGDPDYSKNTAEQCVTLGMQVMSCTPGKLAELISDIIQSKS
jgi:hypothetical protein